MITQTLLPAKKAQKAPIVLALASYGLLTQGSNMITQGLLPAKEAEKLPLSMPWSLIVFLHKDQI